MRVLQRPTAVGASILLHEIDRLGDPPVGLEAWDRLLASLEQTLRLSEARYKAGLDGYLGVLVAQRSLYSSQQAGVGLRLAEKANRVALYKALGGGS